MTWDTEPEQHTNLGHHDDVDLDGLADGDTLVRVAGTWVPGAGGQFAYVDYGSEPNTPRPPFAEVVYWRGNPLVVPDNMQAGDWLYIRQDIP